MHILLIHQNFPGQFRHLAPALAAAGHRVHALAMQTRPVPAGVTRQLYAVQRKPAPQTHPLLRETETKLLRGEACAAAMARLQRDGYRPDLVIANPGWGEALFIKDIWPEAKLVCLLEFFYGTPDADVGFDPEFSQPDLGQRLRHRMKNVALLEALHAMDHGVSPTQWQASRLPREYRSKLDVIFDGIDTEHVAPDAHARFVWAPSNLDLGPDDQVVTFINRNLEPYRGYHVFMRALPELQRLSPKAQIVIVGGDSVSYGAPAPNDKTWKQIFLDEVQDQLDLSRIHFVGKLPYADLLRLFQISAAHVYLTYPFVLSWSCLEAMSAGCHVIGSRTQPVTEYIEDGVNGSLVDFFDTGALAQRIAQVVQSKGKDAGLRAAARRTVIERCDLNRICLPAYRDMLSKVMGAPV